ncbi:MAG: hypothetical protein NC393_11600 [Clostridium sp.]|nr:hypothetical protein [Clostridium sp.]MCM1208606.1 hypothetical protein [Ruminococcus sp.]
MAIQVGDSQVTQAAYSYATAEPYSANSQGSGSSSVEDLSNPENKSNDVAATYDKSDDSTKKATYSVNKMSAEDRANLVSQLKADQEARQQSLISLVQNTIGKQAQAYGIANGGDGMWRFIASGNYTVDAATKAQAQKDISEDGYWGVKQTSQRLFDFASALAGDDVEKMQEMQKAMQKGFKLATKSWGRELPSISSSTLDAANKLFDDYYASKKQKVE